MCWNTRRNRRSKGRTDDAFHERLHAVERLAKAGRRLDNCAKNNGGGLHD